MLFQENVNFEIPDKLSNPHRGCLQFREITMLLLVMYVAIDIVECYSLLKHLYSR